MLQEHFTVLKDIAEMSEIQRSVGSISTKLLKEGDCYKQIHSLSVSYTIPPPLRLAVQICCSCLASAADLASRVAELQRVSAAMTMHAGGCEPTKHHSITQCISRRNITIPSTASLNEDDKKIFTNKHRLS